MAKAFLRVAGLFSLLLVFAAGLAAEPIVQTGGVWLDLPSCTAGQPSCPAWYNPSQDDGVLPLIPGLSRDLASILNNASPYTGIPAFTDVQWYGPDGGVGLIKDLFFSGSGTYNISLLLRETGNNLILGWYGDDGSGNLIGGVLIDGSVAAGQTVTFTPPSNFGFFVKYGRPADCAANDWRAVCQGTLLDHNNGTGVPLDIYYSQTWLSSSVSNPPPGAPPGYTDYESTYDPDRQHFIALRSGEGLIIAVEDSWTTLPQYTTLNTPHNGSVWENGGDFNDLVLLITPVPEPSTFALLGLGFAGLAAFARRRSK